MDCSQILPGAVNLGPCSVATGYLDEVPFICYASDTNLVLLDGRLGHIQTLLGVDFGYGEIVITCMHVAESSGKVAAAWGCDVMIFKPDQMETAVADKFPWSWKPYFTCTFPSKVLSLSFKQDGSQLLVGGDFISLWNLELQRCPAKQDSSPTITAGRSSIEDEQESGWKETWKINMSSPVVHLKFSPDGSMFASASTNDRLVKIWYKMQPRKATHPHRQQELPETQSKHYSFTFIAHPRAITGLVWRKTSVCMKQGAVSNVLLTRCKDNICRLWSHTLFREKAPQSNLLRFFLVSSIDPVADIPFRSTMPVEDADFIVHWLNNKEMTYTNKANHIYQSNLTRHTSFGSIASGPSDDMLSSWVCVEEKSSSDLEAISEESTKYQSYSLEDYLAPPSPHFTRMTVGTPQKDGESLVGLSKKNESQLMEEWINSPDLLVCIHPNNGSLMVWTVEGLDAPRHGTRLVHISFSSCLPHVFPPHLAQTLHQELQQFLLKDPEPIGMLSVPLSPPSILSGAQSPRSTLNTSELNLPVPQIRLPSGRNVIDIPDSTRTLHPSSSLVLLSSHCNGSINAWSVELTVQANYCTSISGLIHCGQTGGHCKEVQTVHRHPWLPVLMTIANKEVKSQVENELIIWNADLAGPLTNKAQVRELSRMSSSESLSFTIASWIPPISLASSNVGALSRCPSFGLFVTNVGNELCLFQTSLYPIIPANSSHTLYHTSCPLHESSSKTITMTSHSGTEGMAFISVVDDDLDKYDNIVALHAFRMNSAAIQSFEDLDTSESIPPLDFSDELLIVLIENQEVTVSSIGSTPQSSFQSYLHIWRIILQEKEVTSLRRADSLDPWYKPQPRYTRLCHAKITKLLSAEPFPLQNPNSYVVQSQPSCDIASSLQLQLPFLFSPYLFTTVCSDGRIHCWQLKVKVMLHETTLFNIGELSDKPSLQVEAYDIFDVGSLHKGSTKLLNCLTNSALKELPLSNFLPCALSCAYPGRFAMAHLLTRPLKTTHSLLNPLSKHGMVSVWECESTGGLQWICESVLSLEGIGGITTGSKSQPESVHLDWLPMENGSYLLATYFNSVISIFGMALPIMETQLSCPSEDIFARRFSKSVSMPVLKSEKAFSSWVCLLNFPIVKPYSGISTRWFAYTGSNSLLIGIGSELQVYSCWVNSERLKSFSHQRGNIKLRISSTPKKHSRLASRLAHTDCINLLDYAHSKNSPLPQYHPKILTDLLNSGKLEAVKLILINLVKYLLLYQERSKSSAYMNFDERVNMEEEDNEKDGSRVRLLSVVDGRLKRSQKALVKVEVENIPPVSLSLLKIFNLSSSREEIDEEGDDQLEVKQDDYDALFSHDLSTTSYDNEFVLEEETIADKITFEKINIETSEFTTDLAQQLTSILHYTRLPDINDVEQVRLLAIAHTVARTKMSFNESPMYSISSQVEAPDLGTSLGAGYAAVGFVPGGIGGGEAMDDCGLRYLFALHNFLTLAVSLPKDIATTGVATSDIIWAFHSDAETELLSNIPCVQDDHLNWPDLRNAGVGWWVRSSDTLRRLSEKLAKSQFMLKQDPMDASLFYLAMKKQSLLKGLFKTVNDSKMMNFFANNFSQERWRKAALKNAFALLSKQRFEHAAAFFLLAGKLWDAIDVCINRLNDLQLALVVTRLYEGDGGPTYERLLKECILGLRHTQEPSTDPFLRSIALWLLQDYSGALETLLVGLSSSQVSITPPDPSIFNIYFYLRSHPLLLRRKYPTKTGHSITPSPSVADFSSHYHSKALSGVGDDPLTPTERNLVFSTAYHHLNSGSPLLALVVLARLPKTEDLGITEETKPPIVNMAEKFHGKVARSESVVAIMSGLIGVSGSLVGGKSDEEPVTFQVDSTDYDETGLSMKNKHLGAIVEEKEEDFDWSKPISIQVPADQDDDFDWSKPVSSQLLEGDDDDFDWSKPVSSQVRSPVNDDKNLKFEEKGKEVKEENSEEGNENKRTKEKENEFKEESSEEEKRTKDQPPLKVISPRGIFILSLAEQLQYNALLSILTEELASIHLPSCCNYLWETRGKESLPLLPLGRTKMGGAKGQSMVEWFDDEAFERVLGTLREKLVDWLKNETLIVKEVCGMEISAGNSSSIVSTSQAAHAGYDLLTTLMNYVSLHAGTLPNMLAVQTELMHLMNTLLPWSTGLSQELEDSDLEAGQTASCAINPAQLPLLCACSLPSKHPLNMALHIRLMSASIFASLSSHSSPPTSLNPLEHTHRVFELCCALSHCVHLCLSPMRLHQDLTSTTQQCTESPQGRQRVSSGSNLLDFLSLFDTPNTKPSRWPGLDDWPSSLLSDDGKEASPLCLVLMEALTVVYIGLLSVAWSLHSTYDLLVLTANAPSQDKWAALFGGGVMTKLPDPSQKKTASFIQRVSSVKKLLRQTSQKSFSGSIGIFAAPKQSLLFHCLTKPTDTRYSNLHFEKEPDDDDEDEDEEHEVWQSESDEDTKNTSDPDNPDCYSWCLMNLGIIQRVQRVLRNTITLTGMEILEFITASPVLYRLLTLMEDWENALINKLQTHVSPPPNLYLPSESSGQEAYGPALTRHKFILEAEHSPFRNDDKSSRLARRLWQYLVHEEQVRETFIRYIFYKKHVGATVDDEPAVQRILYSQPDSPVSSLCISSSNSSIFALATSREVLEIEVPDIMSLDIMNDEDTSTDTNLSSKRNSILFGARSTPELSEDYIMIQPGMSSIRRTTQSISPGHVSYLQSGNTSSILLKRSVPSVKRMASHPTLAYYLTGSADGSIRMFEFGIPKPVSILRRAGAGPGITRIRFTPQGNKYGVTDSSGKLSLWQGIQTYNKEPYQILNPVNTRRSISDFAFLGSSSVIATCGESPDNKNICIWDTLMPTKNTIVKEWVCHESGASCIVFSSTKQRLISGGRRGEIYIFDVRSQAVVSKPVVHSAAVSCIVLNDTDGYFITGAVDGEIKVWDLTTVTELTSILGSHSRSRLFRPDGGVMDMVVDSEGCLYSCGGDGTVKVHSLDLPVFS